MTILVGTDGGLFSLDGKWIHRAHKITALASSGKEWLAVADHRVLLDSDLTELGAFEDDDLRCLEVTSHGVLLGTANARLRLADGLVESFDEVPGRDAWYTPWGGPPDTRSIAEAADGTLHVNVHVGGIPRSRDGGKTWEPTIDVDTDVHQVRAHPNEANLVLAACALGLAVSHDAGDTYEILTDGLHATYSRAVAVAGDTLLVTVSRSHTGQQSAIYRAPLTVDRPFEKCVKGLPEWFSDNIDTGCLDAKDERVVFGTTEGEVFVSEDGGSAWDRAEVLRSPVRAVAIA